jgi:integrase
MRKLDEYSGTPAVRAALRLQPMLFCRPGELRKAKWKDIDLDAEEWRYLVTKNQD